MKKILPLAFIFLIGFTVIGVTLFRFFKEQTAEKADTLLEAAQVYISDCDYILNFTTLHIVWISPKTVELTGYSSDDLPVRNVDLLDEGYDRGLALSRIVNRMFTGGGTFETVIHTKDMENLELKIAYKTFEYQGQGYRVGKLIQHSLISQEEAEKYYTE